MSTITAETLVHKPAAEVFRFVATQHFENHPRWDPAVVEMRQTSPGPVGVGTTARVVRRQGRRLVEGTATVTAYEPDALAAWDVRFGPFRLLQRSEYTPVRCGDATQLRLTIETHASGPIKILVPLMRRRFRRTMEASLSNIRGLIEGDAPAAGARR